METLPQDIVRHIGEFGAGHREKWSKVHRQIRILQRAYQKFHAREFDALGMKYVCVLDTWFFMNSNVDDYPDDYPDTYELEESKSYELFF
jgi:hypothetical protein